MWYILVSRAGKDSGAYMDIRIYRIHRIYRDNIMSPRLYSISSTHPIEDHPQCHLESISRGQALLINSADYRHYRSPATRYLSSRIVPVSQASRMPVCVSVYLST